MSGLEEYRRLRREFSLTAPSEFSFPLDVFDGWAEKSPESLCLFWTDGITERKISFDGMRGLSSKGAGFLRTLGVGAGDNVLVLLSALPEWWELQLALMRLNAIPVPATTMLSAEDIRYRLKTLRAKAVVSDAENAGKVEEALKGLEYAPRLVIIGNGHCPCPPKWSDYIAGRDAAPAFAGERAPSDSPALIFFTSGTTGPPKLVVHTQASYPLAHMITGRFWLDLKPGDLHWNLSDTGWAKAAWSSLFGPWHMGATVFSFYRKGRFDPLQTLDVLGRYPVTVFCGPPTAYRMMVKESGEKIALKGMRHFVAAGEPLNKEVIELWREKTGLWIYDGYGQTETVNMIANLRAVPVKPGSMGLPAPGFDVDVIDEEAVPLPPGIEGDIAIRVRPSRPVGLFKEYMGNPDATRKTLRGDWYITGDRAVKDEEGYFWFVGRADDIILTSGYRIGPFEIESVLIEHPAVEESAVVASPDPLRGEVVKAFVVLTKGYAPSDSLREELQEFVKKHTAPYKYPRLLEFIEELPKTVSGKIKRKELKKREWGQ